MQIKFLLSSTCCFQCRSTNLRFTQYIALYSHHHLHHAAMLIIYRCEIGPNFPICPSDKRNKANGQSKLTNSRANSSKRRRRCHSIRTERGPASWLMDAPHMTLFGEGLKLSPHLSWPNQNSEHSTTKSIFQITFKWAARLIIKKTSRVTARDIKIQIYIFIYICMCVHTNHELWHRITCSPSSASFCFCLLFSFGWLKVATLAAGTPL